MRSWSSHAREGNHCVGAAAGAVTRIRRPQFNTIFLRQIMHAKFVPFFGAILLPSRDIVELRRELRPGGKNGMQNRWATWHKMAASGVFTERPEFSRSPKSLCVDIGPELCGVMMSGDKAWRCC